MTLVIDLDLLYRLIAVVECRPNWNWDLYSTALGVSRKTIYNNMEKYKEDGLGVVIERVGGRKHGHWQITSLGLLDNDYARAQIEQHKKAFTL